MGSRNDFEEEDDLCMSTTKPLIPKELNNIYNKLIKIHQHQSFVQTIYISECTQVSELIIAQIFAIYNFYFTLRNPKSDCSNGGHVMSHQKIICRQHYVRITLMAESESKKTYEEEVIIYLKNLKKSNSFFVLNLFLQQIHFTKIIRDTSPS